ncbi:hypothetical protein K491DRAFT_125093 [Lophiostoma macrostomum CBS 122681]|uniref:Uncharacterized protein n=1 Tax=Lophiostoma macrostomum CBS 122681 TaxID=1314788 RepID=A0A6A6SW76_9PLEO|nr:hypothetical protein K491DRAFT_125093 [Lophiostoma macrostomum CBS 122681]
MTSFDLSDISLYPVELEDTMALGTVRDREAPIASAYSNPPHVSEGYMESQNKSSVEAATEGEEELIRACFDFIAGFKPVFKPGLNPHNEPALYTEYLLSVLAVAIIGHPEIIMPDVQGHFTFGVWAPYLTQLIYRLVIFQVEHLQRADCSTFPTMPGANCAATTLLHVLEEASQGETANITY